MLISTILYALNILFPQNSFVHLIICSFIFLLQLRSIAILSGFKCPATQEILSVC